MHTGDPLPLRAPNVDSNQPSMHTIDAHMFWCTRNPSECIDSTHTTFGLLLFTTTKVLEGYNTLG